MLNKKLSKKEFENSAADFPRMQDKGYSIAYHCLVENWTTTEAAKEFEVNVSYAKKIAKKIYDNYLENHAGCPKGFFVYQGCFTKDDLKKVKKIELDARNKI